MRKLLSWNLCLTIHTPPQQQQFLLNAVDAYNSAVCADVEKSVVQTDLSWIRHAAVVTGSRLVAPSNQVTNKLHLMGDQVYAVLIVVGDEDVIFICTDNSLMKIKFNSTFTQVIPHVK